MLSPKSILTYALLGLVVASVSWVVVKAAMQAGDNPQSRATDSPPAPPANGVAVYYFHGDYRCETCEKFEAYTGKAVTGGFADAIRQGRLQWSIVNTDRPANRHFVQDYKLVSRAVVLAMFRDGKQVRWRSLDKIWDLVDNEGDFERYIHDEIAAELRSMGILPMSLAVSSVAQPPSAVSSSLLSVSSPQQELHENNKTQQRDNEETTKTQPRAAVPQKQQQQKQQDMGKMPMLQEDQ